MFKFKIQRFANYQVTDVVTVGQVKALATRIALRLTALENTTIKSLKPEGNKLKFYACALADVKETTVPVATYDVPEEIYLNQTGTTIEENFTFSTTKYPDATDPNLDGKTVLVLSVKGDDPDNPTVEYSFVDMSSLIGNYMTKDKTATAGNLAEFTSDGAVTSSTIPASAVLTTIAGAQQGNIMTFTAKGKVADSGHSIATDTEFDAMLDEVLPTVKSGDNS